MRAIAGPGHVSNEFVDYDAVTNPTGTVVTADWGNDVQDELLAIQNAKSVAEAAGTNGYVLSVIKAMAIEHGKRIGELYWIDDYEAPAAFDKDNPDDYHPGLCLSAIDGHSDIAASNWPDLVPHLRDLPAVYLKGKAGEATSYGVNAWDITSNEATLTFDNNAAENALLSALAEDQLVNGGYGNWRSITLASAIGDITAGDYAITDVDTAARTISFDFTASDNSGTGTYTVSHYPFRIPGSTTTARVFEVNGRTLVSAGDADGEAFAGLLRRDRMQGHAHALIYRTGSGAQPSVVKDAASYDSNQDIDNGIINDGTNGTPRTGKTTDPRAMIGHLYIHARRYVA